MNITATVTGIEYSIRFADAMKTIDADSFDINTVPPSCLLRDGNHTFGISKWVSPKRTRSYPYARIHTTLSHSKKITVIPVIKDEGAAGDRDFIQWDTVSLMSLLDVFVILAYYTTAEAAGNKITRQRFDNNYVLEKIRQIEQYHSSALHWNLNELHKGLHSVVERARMAYSAIEKNTGVKLHSESGLEKFQQKISSDIDSFMTFSREKSGNAQLREYVTLQPKEYLATQSKAMITITNYLGGQYFFTVDEIQQIESTLLLIETKHSRNALLPAKDDIKDGLLKMILYCNLSGIMMDEALVEHQPVLQLTSDKLRGSINSDSPPEEIDVFFRLNHFNQSRVRAVSSLFAEANANSFTVRIKEAS